MAGKKDGFEITKLFMALANIDTRFSGTIESGSDSDGHPVIRDRIKADNGSVMAQAGHQDELGEHLVEMVRMVLGYQYIV